MHTVGALTRVHANGRVNYADQPPTHADGRELGADRAFEAAERLRAVAAVAFGKGGVGKGVGEEEEEEDAMLDAALDAVLDAEMEGEEALSDEDGEEDEEEGDGALTPPWPPGEGVGAHHRVVEADKEKKGSAPPAAPAEAEAAAEEEGPREKPPPRNFSRVQDPLHPDRGAFPDFPAEPPVEVAVAPGSMLYLPAGWFHEVGRGRSIGPYRRGVGGGSSAHVPSLSSFPLHTQVISSGGVHTAFNYWVHPPDTADFARPYASRFWPRDWEERMALEGAKKEKEG